MAKPIMSPLSSLLPHVKVCLNVNVMLSNVTFYDFVRPTVGDDIT